MLWFGVTGVSAFFELRVCVSVRVLVVVAALQRSAGSKNLSTLAPQDQSLFLSIWSARLWYVSPATCRVLIPTSVSPTGLGAPGEQKAGSHPSLHFQLLAQFGTEHMVSTWELN